ncbi:hypothetical protein [Candidatus Deferrimicrobium sp.]|uniref:hypothetical protein n=1 Tax=Candidatus Deferrimicrobium sp. TaxID=3060586 RepID=UPI002ED29741
MKTYTARMAVLAVLGAITMAGSAFAGQTQEERDMALRHRADPESAMGWQIRSPVETGSVKADNARQLKSEGTAKTEVPTVDIGGRVYRIGIDTP